MASAPPFTTTREELWAALVEELPHGWRDEEGGGRSYYTLNRDLFRALHDFFNRKENEALDKATVRSAEPSRR